MQGTLELRDLLLDVEFLTEQAGGGRWSRSIATPLWLTLAPHQATCGSRVRSHLSGPELVGGSCALGPRQSRYSGGEL